MNGMKNKYQNAESIGIISGVDGPTSVLITGKERKKSLKIRIRNYIYQQKRKKVGARI